MSEKLFDLVMVEREGHAFNVVMQYEKQQLYCAHCKILGHNVQNCMKLIFINTQDTVQKVSKKPIHDLKQAKTTKTVALRGNQPETSGNKHIPSELTNDVHNPKDGVPSPLQLTHVHPEQEGDDNVEKSVFNENTNQGRIYY